MPSRRKIAKGVLPVRSIFEPSAGDPPDSSRTPRGALEHVAAIVASTALAEDGPETLVLGADVVSERGAIAAVEKAAELAKHWVVELPIATGLGELLAISKAAGCFLFSSDLAPDSIFASSEAPSGDVSILSRAGALAIEKALRPRAVDDASLARTASRLVVVHKTTEERFVLGVVLEPDVADSQGDTYSANEIRSTAHKFMEAFAQLGLQHAEIVTGKLKILESYLLPSEASIGGQDLAAGTWVLGIRVVDDDLWSSVRDGSLTGFSIGGSAVRTPLA